ncbi:MAG: hypothetical protein SGI83_15215 [Bacteroidota bacterium]|nr:hypothetical protein [Bacteroidota bacterium]
MKKLLCLLAFVCGIDGYSQVDTIAVKTRNLKQLVVDDSALLHIQQWADSAITNLRLPDSNQVSDNISRTMNSILELQRERKAREKKAAMVRIGIGLVLLAVLVIGWRRRRKVER